MYAIVEDINDPNSKITGLFARPQPHMDNYIGWVELDDPRVIEFIESMTWRNG